MPLTHATELGLQLSTTGVPSEMVKHEDASECPSDAASVDEHLPGPYARRRATSYRHPARSPHRVQMFYVLHIIF